MDLSCASKGLGWILRKTSQKEESELEQAVQGDGGVTVPGSVQEMYRCGSYEHVLLGIVVDIVVDSWIR